MECPLCKGCSNLDQSVSVVDLVALWNTVGVDVRRIVGSEDIGKYACDNCGLGFYFPFFPGDDKFYGSLALWDWYYKHPGKTEYEFSSKLALPGMRLIDVGCGIGEFSEFLPKQVDFLGVELSSKSVELANTLGRNVKQIDINNAPDDFNNHFDMVTCFQVLEHIVDVDAFVKSLIKLCKPGGIIVIAVPNNDGFVGGAVNNMLNMPPHHILLWNKSSLYFLASKYNLIVDTYIEERLTDIHRRWFFSVFIRRIFMRLLSKPIKVVDHDKTLLVRLINRLATYLSRPLTFIFPKLNRPGHSSIIVLKKPIHAEI
jgi:2-polyprenyl-3-methyl-5-hydroxy-6-metoxy-1,4-benzoquinol methylase